MQTEFEKENNYIIKNYRNMKYADIARHLGISPGAVNSRIAKLREAGVIRKKNRAENKAPRRTQPVKITYKGNPNKFERNKKYRITHWSARNLAGNKEKSKDYILQANNMDRRICICGGLTVPCRYGRKHSRLCTNCGLVWKEGKAVKKCNAGRLKRVM